MKCEQVEHPSGAYVIFTLEGGVASAIIFVGLLFWWLVANIHH
jgi:hypothetical protein